MFSALGEAQDLSLRLYRRLIYIAVVTRFVAGCGLLPNYFAADLFPIHWDSLQSRIATGLLCNVVLRRGLRSFLADLARPSWLAMASLVLNLRAACHPRKPNVLLCKDSTNDHDGRWGWNSLWTNVGNVVNMFSYIFALQSRARWKTKELQWLKRRERPFNECIFFLHWKTREIVFFVAFVRHFRFRRFICFAREILWSREELIFQKIFLSVLIAVVHKSAAWFRWHESACSRM